MTRHLHTNALLLAFALLLACPLAAQEQVPRATPLPDGISSPQEYHAYIVGLYRRNFHDLAAEQAARFEGYFPQDPLAEDILRIRIESLYTLKRHAEAAEAVRLFLNKFPKSEHREALCSRAAASLFELKRYDEAAKNYASLLASKDKELAEAAAYFLAQCLLAQGKAQEAQTHMETLASKTLAAKHPYRLHAAFYLATTKFRSGQYEAALAGYRALLAIPDIPPEMRRDCLLPAADICQGKLLDFKAAAEYYGAFAVEFAQDPRCPYARRALLTCLFRLENYPQYARSASDYLKDYPKAASEDADLLYRLAYAQMTQRQYAPALKTLEALELCAAAKLQHRLYAAKARIICLGAIGQYANVPPLVDKYLADYPAANDKVEILVQGGNAADRLNQADKAIAYYKQALALSAADLGTYQQIGAYLAQYYARKARWPEAAVLYEELSRRTPDAVQRTSLAMDAARAAYRAKDHVKAETLARAIAASQENSRDTRAKALEITYAATYANGNFAAAAADAMELAALHTEAPAQAAIWLEQAGNAFIAAKDYPKAIKALDKAVASEGLPAKARPEILLRLVELFLYEKQAGEAVERGALLLLSPQEAYDPMPYKEALLRLAKEASEKRPEVARAAWKTLLAQANCPVPVKVQCLESLAESLLETQPDEASSYLDALTALLPPANGKSSLPPTAASVAAELALRKKLYTVALQEANAVLDNPKAAGAHRALARARWVKAQVLFEYDKDLNGALSLATLGFVISQQSDPVYTPRARQLAAEILRQQGHPDQAREILLEP